MAKVKWQKRAERELYRYLVKGFLKFGETTANNFASRVATINDDLSKYPETGFPEPLLKDRKKLYRAKHILKRFKLIYYYCEKQTRYTYQIFGIHAANRRSWKTE